MAQKPVNLPEVTPSEVNHEEYLAGAFDVARQNSPFTLLEKQAAKAVENAVDVAYDMADFAAKFLGTRYRLGSSGPKAFDCSGFTSYVFRNFGIDLLRTSRAQYTQGEKVDKNDLKPGDLLFFSSRSSGRGNVGHVGIVVDVNEDGSCRFIHASTKRGVVYQNYPDGGYYQQHYIGARRVIGVL